MVSKWWHEYQVVVEVVVVDDASMAKMSSGDVDVEPYLDSRNTKGYGNHNSKFQGPKCGTIAIGCIGEDGGVCGFGRCGGRWGGGGD